MRVKFFLKWSLHVGPASRQAVPGAFMVLTQWLIAWLLRRKDRGYNP